MKKKTLASMIISLIIGVILGIIIVLLAGIVNVSFLVKWTMIIMGVIIIISNVPSLVTGAMNVKKTSGLINLIMSVIGIAMGAMMIFMQNEVITAILAVYLIVFPIIYVVISKDWKNAIKSEWLKILIGVLLIAFMPAIMGAADAIVKVIMLVAGWATVAISVLIFLVSLFIYLCATKKFAKKDEQFYETTDYSESNSENG